MEARDEIHLLEANLAEATQEGYLLGLGLESQQRLLEQGNPGAEVPLRENERNLALNNNKVAVLKERLRAALQRRIGELE